MKAENEAILYLTGTYKLIPDLAKIPLVFSWKLNPMSRVNFALVRVKKGRKEEGQTDFFPM